MQPTRRDLLLAAAAMAPALASGNRPTLAATTPPGTLRLVSFSTAANAKVRVGVLRDSGDVVDVVAEAARLGRTPTFDPSSMLSLIAAGPDGLDQVRAILTAAQTDLPTADVRLAAPIPVPARNVYAVGWNYLEHFAENAASHQPNQKYPDHPVFFSKASHSVNGPYDPIPYDPEISTMIDWEGELAVIIGKKGKNIAEANALEYVFGYSIINDTTARDFQYTRHGGQWFKGKSLDGHGPMGPCIVVKGGVDPENLHLVTRVNGIVKQDAMTAQMYFKVPKIIAELSIGLTLEPGDIIASGTPSGIGYARTPKEFLKPGDVMETEISGIGVIRNEIKLLG